MLSLFLCVYGWFCLSGGGVMHIYPQDTSKQRATFRRRIREAKTTLSALLHDHDAMVEAADRVGSVAVSKGCITTNSKCPVFIGFQAQSASSPKK